MKKSLGTVFGLLLLASAPSSALAPSQGPVKGAMKEGVSAVREFRAENSRLPGDHRGARLVKQKGNGIDEFYGRVGSRNEFCAGAVEDVSEHAWFFDSVRGEAFRATFRKLKQTPGACRSIIRADGRASVLRSEAQYLALGVENYYVDHEELPPNLGRRWRADNEVRLNKGTSVHSYAPADNGVYTFCVVAKRRGYAFYDAGSGALSSDGYGRACKA